MYFSSSASDVTRPAASASSWHTRFALIICGEYFVQPDLLSSRFSHGGSRKFGSPCTRTQAAHFVIAASCCAVGGPPLPPHTPPPATVVDVGDPIFATPRDPAPPQAERHLTLRTAARRSTARARVARTGTLHEVAARIAERSVLHLEGLFSDRRLTHRVTSVAEAFLFPLRRV